ncbi:Thiamine-monophosphate kinase [Porphyromonas macacae]|uniref:Thiamine-monophosphate kinase n=1 Tax=Porphyromonas macacae TaxID=28115 RepID=A0A379EAQ5_9PORP|nr:thiamine-phosphate kinase [Porphyromonas macacae]SUB89778.1 Thiamine-monophosphate kinase [Porphyromonas macacae]
MQRTEISSLGEFVFIEHLTKDFKPKNKSTETSIGDDAAVLNYGEGKRVLVTTDMLLEGIHFDLVYCPLKHLGYKAAVVNFSDIYAMFGTPAQLTVSIGISKRFSVEDIEELYAGIRLACDLYNVDLIGGDTCASMTGLTLSLTCIGEANPEEIVYRKGAQPTDLICVSGNLGASYMGLQLLEREKRVFDGDKDFVPAFEGHEYILERQLKPEARKDIVESLKKANIKPTSMMDISDGLSSELLHISQNSHVGIRIYEDRLPIDYQTASMAEQMNLNVTTVALNGGEDYELLFTVPLAMHDLVADIDDIHIIGHITAPELGAALVTRDGAEIRLRAQGWNAFNEN